MKYIIFQIFLMCFSRMQILKYVKQLVFVMYYFVLIFQFFLVVIRFFQLIYMIRAREQMLNDFVFVLLSKIILRDVMLSFLDIYQFFVRIYFSILRILISWLIDSLLEFVEFFLIYYLCVLKELVLSFFLFRYELA